MASGVPREREASGQELGFAMGPERMWQVTPQQHEDAAKQDFAFARGTRESTLEVLDSANDRSKIQAWRCRDMASF